MKLATILAKYFVYIENNLNSRSETKEGLVITRARVGMK